MRRFPAESRPVHLDGAGEVTSLAAQEKAALRRWAKRTGAVVDPDRRRSMSAAVLENARGLGELRAARHLLVCVSFGNEVDTHPLLAELSNDSLRAVYVPRVDRDGRMHVHPFPCRMRRLSMGLSQPVSDEPEVSADTIDVAIVLGLAFARDGGYRLGHGRGYFDRFLADARALAVGLSFEAAMVDHLPIAPHDVPMAIVVTEERVYRFLPDSDPATRDA